MTLISLSDHEEVSLALQLDLNCRLSVTHISNRKWNPSRQVQATHAVGQFQALILVGSRLFLLQAKTKRPRLKVRRGRSLAALPLSRLIFQTRPVSPVRVWHACAKSAKGACTAAHPSPSDSNLTAQRGGINGGKARACKGGQAARDRPFRTTRCTTRTCSGAGYLSSPVNHRPASRQDQNQ